MAVININRNQFEEMVHSSKNAASSDSLVSPDCLTDLICSSIGFLSRIRRRRTPAAAYEADMGAKKHRMTTKQILQSVKSFIRCLGSQTRSAPLTRYKV